MTPMTLITLAAKSATVRAAFAAIALMGLHTTQASAVGLGVKLACAADYYSYCSHHPVGSAGVRQCMRSHGEHLSKRCVNALVAAGEVSRTEVDRRRAAKAGKSMTASAD
ncbi:hypothetical protein [Hyphomicrobium sp.]|uniref:hypothetical protein n=1 Tax=Hyphomicrobium sp. TaxID=82 RepID=UPI0025B95718|nr:hypothetical protein [Hyphomicrobium sp.]